MNNSKVFIVKMKWEEMTHFSKVKRVFFNEENAHDYIDQEKVKEENLGAFWVMSDREISDYEPCMSDKDIELVRIDERQAFIEGMLSSQYHPNRTSKWDPNKFLEDQWAINEKHRIELTDA